VGCLYEKLEHCSNVRCQYIDILTSPTYHVVWLFTFRPRLVFNAPSAIIQSLNFRQYLHILPGFNTRPFLVWLLSATASLANFSWKL